MLMKQEYEQALRNDPALHFYFTISLPASRKRGKRIGNTLFESPEHWISEILLDMLRSECGKDETDVYYLNPSDFMNHHTYDSRLFDIKENSIVVLPDQMGENTRKPKELLRDFRLNVRVGKGECARDLSVAISPVTFVLFSIQGSDNYCELQHCFEHVIPISDTCLKRLYKIKAKELFATEAAVLSDEAAAFLVQQTGYDYIKLKRYQQMITDYVLLKGMDVPTVTRSLAETVLKLAGCNVQ